MALHFKLQLVVATDDDKQVSVDELVVLSKDYERLEHLGLTLAEAKALLVELQHQILSRQLAAFLASRTPCPSCGRTRGIKDHKTIVFRTQRRRAGQAISTAFVESLVNSLLSKRFAKKQSMQWTPEGAHLLLQTRTRTLNGDLTATFHRWYPACSLEDKPVHGTSLAA
jgi:hypothetical protein